MLHDVRLDGHLSKTERQIDVLVRQRIGQYEMLIVIDCKDYARPVNVKGIEEFHGLLRDVGAHRGALVCPTGFTVAAKQRAMGLQINLYSPVDTDPHKWQVRVAVPAICDFRSAMISFQIQMNAPKPLRIMDDFWTANSAFGSEGQDLGKPMQVTMDKWNRGLFPTEPGRHQYLPIFDHPTVLVDNGYGERVPVQLSVSVWVKQQLYFGHLPIPKISGFRDELSGKVITNAFTVGILDPEEVETGWARINS